MILWANQRGLNEGGSIDILPQLAKLAFKTETEILIENVFRNNARKIKSRQMQNLVCSASFALCALETGHLD